MRVTSIHASPCSCHFIALDIDGAAWLFGRNAPQALGRAGKDGVVPETAPRRLTARALGAPPGTRFVHAAVGRSHSLLVGSNGDVWTAGANSHGQVRPLFDLSGSQVAFSFLFFLLTQRIVWTTYIGSS